MTHLYPSVHDMGLKTITPSPYGALSLSLRETQGEEGEEENPEEKRKRD